MWGALLGLGTKAVPVLRKYWLYIVVALLFSGWLIFTIVLYNNNQDLHEDIGKSQAAITLCISERATMDETLKKLKTDLAATQKLNEEYKNKITEANKEIANLEADLANSDIDVTPIPTNCEETFKWMFERIQK